MLHIVSLTTKIGHSHEIFDALPLGPISAIMDSIGWPVAYETIVDYVRQEAAIMWLANRFEETFGARGMAT